MSKEGGAFLQVDLPANLPSLCEVSPDALDPAKGDGIAYAEEVLGLSQTPRCARMGENGLDEEGPPSLDHRGFASPAVLIQVQISKAIENLNLKCALNFELKSRFELSIVLTPTLQLLRLLFGLLLRLHCSSRKLLSSDDDESSRPSLRPSLPSSLTSSPSSSDQHDNSGAGPE